MMTVYKYGLQGGDTKLSIPEGAKFLRCHIQQDTACLWFLVDTHAKKEVRVFRIFGTGCPIEPAPGMVLRYFGTFDSDPFVWHVFEECLP